MRENAPPSDLESGLDVRGRFANLPAVVLAGRPNVGKSTLFNRLAGKRRAITAPVPGLTRDPVTEDVLLCGKPVRLVDTGGFTLERGGPDEAASLRELVVDRTLGALERASLVILILEAGNISGEDEEFIEILRPMRDKLIVAVNKTEGGRKTGEAWNLLRYGFDSVYMISAEHGDNVEELKEAVAARLDLSGVTALDAPERPAIRVTLVGKPNSGKSTLSNRLTGSAASIVSPVPGTTRDVLEGGFDWKGRRFRILDTAGIRRKSKVSENIEYYGVQHAIKTMDGADIVIIMVDAKEGFSDQDKKIAALACERGRGVIFLLNKWDTMGAVKNTFNAVRDKIRYFFGQMSWAPVLAASALRGDGVDALLETCVRMHAELCRRTGTAAFNEALRDWQAAYPPPASPAARFRIKYGTQVRANPVVFRLFVSRPRACKDSYLAYIQRKIREDLGYSSIPLKLDIAPSAPSPRAGAKGRGGGAPR